jgi:hypothetical protein
MAVVPGLPVGVLARVAEVLMAVVPEVLMALVPGWRPPGVALRVIAVMPLAMAAAMPGRIGAVTRRAAVAVAV